jgi:hypothetical protein
MPRLTLAPSAGREQGRRGGQPQQHHGRDQGAQHPVPVRHHPRRTERPARAAFTPLGAGQVPMGPGPVTAPARPRGHAATLADNDVASSSVNPRPPRRSCGSRLRLALCSRQRGAGTVAARSGRRCRFVVMRLVLSRRPVARTRPGQGDGGIAATPDVSASTAPPAVSASTAGPHLLPGPAQSRVRPPRGAVAMVIKGRCVLVRPSPARSGQVRRVVFVVSNAFLSVGPVAVRIRRGSA